MYVSADERTNSTRIDKTMEKIKTSVVSTNTAPTQSLSEEHEDEEDEEFIVEHSLEELNCIKEEECIELEVNYRETILRELGVQFLDEKYTRAKRSDDETDIMIVKENGISYINENEWEEKKDEVAASKLKQEEEEKIMGNVYNPMIRTLPLREANILRNAGVTWDEQSCFEFADNSGESTVAILKKGWTATMFKCHVCSMPVVVSNSKDILECVKCGFVMVGVDNYSENGDTFSSKESMTVNSSYAERELTRLLKKGYLSTGKECDCGMPIICKSRGGLLECVSCGVVGGEDDDNKSDNNGPSSFISPKILKTMSSMTNNHQSIDDETQASMAYEMEAEFNEALGSLLFDGWQLSKLNCENCNLPLVVKSDGDAGICLKCG